MRSKWRCVDKRRRLAATSPFKNSQSARQRADNCENAINYPVQIVIVNNK